MFQEINVFFKGQLLSVFLTVDGGYCYPFRDPAFPKDNHNVEDLFLSLTDSLFLSCLSYNSRRMVKVLIKTSWCETVVKEQNLTLYVLCRGYSRLRHKILIYLFQWQRVSCVSKETYIGDLCEGRVVLSSRRKGLVIQVKVH